MKRARCLALCAVTFACTVSCGPVSPPEEPQLPDFRAEVLRGVSDADDVASLWIALDGAAPFVAFNDLEHRGVAVAHRRLGVWTVEYPVTEVSHTLVQLESVAENSVVVRYANAPRTAILATWDGQDLGEQSREDLSEDAFASLGGGRMVAIDGYGRTHRVEASSQVAIQYHNPVSTGCAELQVREGSRLAGPNVALAVDSDNRPHLLYAISPLQRREGEGELRYALCRDNGWAVTTVGPAAGWEGDIAVDEAGHPHIVFVRATEQGAELVYATSAAPSTEPEQGDSCAPGFMSQGEGCVAVDGRVVPALEACSRIELADEPVTNPYLDGDGWRCAVLVRNEELSTGAARYAASRCESTGTATDCYLAAAFVDVLVASMAFDPLLCNAPPGGTCSDHHLYVSSIAFEHVPADRDEALRLYGRACNGGHDGGCLRLASLVLMQDRNAALAYRSAQPRCLEGHLAACALAVEATRGQAPAGAAHLLSRAASLFEERCGRGSSSACNNLAHMLVGGEGVTENRERAATLFRTACNAGHEPSCNNARELQSQ